MQYMIQKLLAGIRTAACAGGRLLLLPGLCSAVAAQEPPGCAAYAVDLGLELFVMATPAIPLFAATTPADPLPTVETGREYHLIMGAQTGFEFAAEPERRMPAEDTYAGLVGFTVPEDGVWRISLSREGGIDVISADSRSVKSGRQDGQAQCETLQKFVEFRLRAGTQYVLQLYGGTASEVSVLVSGPLESAE